MIITEKLNLYLEENSEIDILNSFKDYIKYKNKEFNNLEKSVIEEYKIIRKENEDLF